MRKWVIKKGRKYAVSCNSFEYVRAIDKASFWDTKKEAEAAADLRVEHVVPVEITIKEIKK